MKTTEQQLQHVHEQMTELMAEYLARAAYLVSQREEELRSHSFVPPVWVNIGGDVILPILGRLKCWTRGTQCLWNYAIWGSPDDPSAPAGKKADEVLEMIRKARKDLENGGSPTWNR